MSYFVVAVDHTDILLFKQVGSTCFQKLMIRSHGQMEQTIPHHGRDVFGFSSAWICPFELLQNSEQWDGTAFEADYRAMTLARASARASADPGFGRNAALRCNEVVHVASLCVCDYVVLCVCDYVVLDIDRRCEMLEIYIQRHVDSGIQNLPNYKCLLASGFCGRWAWRWCLHRYMDVPTEVVGICYGRKRTVEIPILLLKPRSQQRDFFNILVPLTFCGAPPELQVELPAQPGVQPLSALRDEANFCR